MPVQPVAHPASSILIQLGTGQLDDPTARAVLAHLDICAECRTQAASLSGDDLLQRLRVVHAAKRAGAETAGSSNTRPPSTAPEASPAAIPPELRDHAEFEVIRKLGGGGMGVVYLVRDRVSLRLEVLKVVTPYLAAQPGVAERFLREIRAVAQLQHENIVRAYGALQIGTLLGLKMEYVPGNDLDKVVKTQLAKGLGLLPVVTACYCAYKAANGLQHAFGKGMVHRDIKPGNLMLAREEKQYLVKVLDFGLVKAMVAEGNKREYQTGTALCMGTPEFMAPEQFMDAARADIRADIYSLGCTLYFLLTGRPPFSGRSLPDYWDAHRSMAATSLSAVRKDVPAELAEVVAKMMAKDPAQRYQTPKEAAQALLPFVKAGVKPPPPAARGKPEPPAPSAVGGGPGMPVPPLAKPMAVPVTMIEGEDTLAQGKKKAVDPWKGRAVAPNPRRKRVMYLLAAAACVVTLAATYFLGPWSQSVDAELQRDWDDADRVMKTTGFSLPFYRERGPKRVQAWKRLAERNNAMGMYLYARCLQEGIGVSKDESEAFQWCRKAADLGNPRAMNALGFCYDFGTGVTKDAAEGMRWYRKAADLREPTAMRNLGHCYLSGMGVSKNEQEAVRWFREAADEGDSGAMIGLGGCYQNGTGVPANKQEAVQWFRQAAAVGNASAMTTLGGCYWNGIGVERDKKKALEWYHKAADADGVDGMIRLAELMIDGDEFVTRSPFDALTLLKKAQSADAERGGRSKYWIQEWLVRAQLRLGEDDLRATRYGDARSRLTEAGTMSDALNRERPGRFYFRQDLAQTWFQLGNLERAEGNGRAAADYYRKAMAADGPEMTKATEALAELLEKGEGVAENRTKAAELRTISARQKIKRFTVQCKIGDGGVLYPVDVYVFEVFPWRHPLETQNWYFKNERGFELPREVMDSFERLHKIAKENNVSFTELCVYALGEKKKDKAGDEKPPK